MRVRANARDPRPHTQFTQIFIVSVPNIRTLQRALAARTQQRPLSRQRGFPLYSFQEAYRKSDIARTLTRALRSSRTHAAASGSMIILFYFIESLHMAIICARVVLVQDPCVQRWL